MKNRELANIFNRMADILEFKGENPSKISAYLREEGCKRESSNTLSQRNSEMKSRKRIMEGIGNRFHFTLLEDR